MIQNLFEMIFISPLLWIVVLAFIFFTRIKMKEAWLSESVKIFSLYMAISTFLLFIITLFHSPSFLLIDYEDWFKIGDYQFKLRFIVDLLGSTYALLTTALIGVIFRFSRNYLHREEGYFRFIFLLSTLMFGLIIVSFARSLDILFAGWELVGTTSILLISYFYNRALPVFHATKAIVSYRLCDMGILAAAAWAHLYLHSHDFILIPKLIEHNHGYVGPVLIGFFIIWASLAKAGQFPMCSWLPTAMEGPTPSSAIFYGALSVHLGPFLLLRFHDYFEHYPVLLITIGLIGSISSIYATLVGRTRSDAKTMLAYATISQVGIIYVEIALGFTHFALFHMVTHASLRTYQFLRSSSLIQDFTENPAVVQNVTIKRSFIFEKYFSNDFRKKLYVHSLNEFHLDFFTYKIIQAFLYPMRVYLVWEQKWMDLDTKVLKFLLRKIK
jgi:NADH-quinone oxidoreductase subunit L